MSAVIATIPKYQFSDATGAPLAGGTLTTYIAGTTTLTNTWQDEALSTLNTNPIVLDSRGECVLWLSSTVNYKFVLKNSVGVTQWTVDDVSGSDSGLRDALAASGGAALVGFVQAGAGAQGRTVQSKLRELVSSADFNNTRGTDNLGFGPNAIVAMQPAGAGTGVDNIGIGTSALAACSAGFGNTALGKNALKTLTTPAYCTAVGAYALENADQPSNVNLLCTAVGAYALNAVVSGGQYNTAVGAYAGKLTTSGYFNTYVGHNAGSVNTTGFSNTGIGQSALLNATGNFNTVVGNNAAQLQTTAVGTVALGYNACQNNLTGSYSVGIGYAALAQATVGGNVAVGQLAGYALQTGQYNVAVGDKALTTANGVAAQNTAIGANALGLLTSNGDNTAVGYNALAKTINNQQTAVGSGALGNATNGGGGSVALGYNAGGSVTTGANILAIGSNAGTDAVRTVTTNSNEIVLGNNSHTAAYIKVAWTVTSDRRDKTDFQPIDRGLGFVMGLQPVSFKLMNRETGQATTGKRFGFGAQDILALEGDDAVLVDTSDSENLKLRESFLVPVLVKAIQEQQAQIKALHDQLAALPS